MSDRERLALAKAAGLMTRWTDARGKPRTVSQDALRAVLTALGLPNASSAQIRNSQSALAERNNAVASLRVVSAGAQMALKGHSRFARFEGATSHFDARVVDERTKAPTQPGYYLLNGQHVAVVPKTAWTLGDVAPRRMWGVAAQIYSLRGGTTRDFGDFAALEDFARDAASHGADAVAMSPVHALFGSDLHRFSPYSPSTRLFLNPLYASSSMQVTDKEDARFIDWPQAGRMKMDALRRAFENADKNDFALFADQGGKALLCHARFEVLDQRFRAQGLHSWRDWPGEYRDCNSAAVQRLSAADSEVAFQIFLQWRARESLGSAQATARDAGMRIGLIADLAIGVDAGGSQAWANPREMLDGLNIGAPPDIFNPAGQSWGVTGFSPLGLQETAFAGYLATLRAAMTDSGGIRLDHAMGLLRLWMVPNGASATDGVYLRYPFHEMLGLLALESRLHRAVVIAEDLGTVPSGFRERLAQHGIHGMAVLWFERNRQGAFTPPGRWNRNAAALSTTHDLPTLAGWWSGRDIVWQKKRQPKTDVRVLRSVREQDRVKLWNALGRAGCAKGAKPKQSAEFSDAATRFLAKTPCPMVLLPLEDFVGEKEQPNLPGTIDEHPNWRRRARTAYPFRVSAARKRAQILETERPK